MQPTTGWIMRPGCCTISCPRRTTAFRKKCWNTPGAWPSFPTFSKAASSLAAKMAAAWLHAGRPKAGALPAFFAITGGSWGLQIGVEGIDLVMIIQNDKGMNQLIGSGFELGADASAAAGPVGRHASADTNWKLDTEILTYSRAKGAFAGVTLNGASIRRDDDSTEATYGRDISTRRILSGDIAVPDSARSFLNAVRDAKAQAIASN